MIVRIHLIALSILFTLSINPDKAKAGAKVSIIDSTCCVPDSLRVISTNYPVFCVSWDVRSDSCATPQGFEIQWKLLNASVWKTKLVPNTGSTITFCDTADCGKNIWRVRTKCDDSTYSDWVYGPTFTMICPHDFRIKAPTLSISPNPASESIMISAKLKPGKVQVFVMSNSGRKVLSKTVFLQEDGLLREKLSVTGLQKGIYFVSIVSNRTVIIQHSFIKE